MNRIIRCTSNKLGSKKITELLYDTLKEKDTYVYIIDECENVYDVLANKCSIYIKLIAMTKDDYYIRSVIRHITNICNKRTKELQLNGCISYIEFNKRFRKHMTKIRVIINESELTKETANLLYYLEKNCENVNIEVWKTEIGDKFTTSTDIVAIKESSIRTIDEQDFSNLECITFDKNLTEKFNDKNIPNLTDYKYMDNIRHLHQKSGECIIFLGKRRSYSNNVSDTNVIFTSNTVSRLAIFSDSETVLSSYRRIVEMNIDTADRININLIQIRKDEDVWRLQDNKDTHQRNHIVFINSNIINKSNLDYLLEDYSNKILAFKNNNIVASYTGDELNNELVLVDKLEFFKRYDIKKDKENAISQLTIKRSF